MQYYDDISDARKARRALQRGLRFVYFIHSQLVKPDYPVLFNCAGCGRPVFEANSKSLEISNSFGISQKYLRASDSWIRLKCNSCGAHISILFK